MKDKIKTMSTNPQRDDFKTLWQHRMQWHEQAEKSAPEDETLLYWVEKAQKSPIDSQVKVISFPYKNHKRWIPYAVAASLVIGVTVIRLTHQSQPNKQLPVAKEVTVDGQTIQFLCNNGCSAQDIMLSANAVIK